MVEKEHRLSSDTPSTSGAVSYTHLDVYKRQVQERLAGLYQPVKSYIITH